MWPGSSARVRTCGRCAGRSRGLTKKPAGEFIYHHHTFGDHAYSNCASGGGGGGGAKGAGAAHRLLQAAAAAGDSAVNVKFRLELHSGDLFYVTRHGHPPLKLLPP